MKETYEKAIAQVFEEEGGYTNDASDPGGPTNWGITIFDARMYWKKDATAGDVKNMPKSVAVDIYRKHYADPICYDDLPPGLDHAALDYSVNSGLGRGIPLLQKVVGAPIDGKLGPETIKKAKEVDLEKAINQYYDERLAFLKGLSLWSTYGRGWGARCKRGRALDLELMKTKPVVTGKTSTTVAGGAVVAGGVAAAVAQPHLWPWILLGGVAILIALFIGYNLWNDNVRKTQSVQ